MYILLLHLLSLTIVSKCFIGIKITEDDSGCEVSFHHLKNLEKRHWSNYHPSYSISTCSQILDHPNWVHFSLTTRINGTVLVTMVLYNPEIIEESFQIGYLNPNSRKFSFKLLNISDECLGADKNEIQIISLLNFQKSYGKGVIEIHNLKEKCSFVFDETDLFNDNDYTIIYGNESISKNEFLISDDDEVSNQLSNYKALSSGFMLQNYLKKSQTFDETIDPDWPLYVSGNYSFIKKQSRKRNPKEYYAEYIAVDTSTKEWELSTNKWPDYYYIFDEEPFGTNLTLPNDRTKEAVRWILFKVGMFFLVMFICFLPNFIE